uniref:Uncharacterized protein n=1 Tax=Haptolina ericina TaxID=156174 RepID=A0A7S3F6F5_9EUKA
MAAALECDALNRCSQSSSGLTTGRAASLVSFFDSSAFSLQNSAQLNLGKIPSFCQPFSTRSFERHSSKGRFAHRSTSPSLSFPAATRSCHEMLRPSGYALHQRTILSALPLLSVALECWVGMWKACCTSESTGTGHVVKVFSTL